MKNLSTSILIFVLVALLGSDGVFAEFRSVRSIVDGDTIRIESDGGSSELVRLIGIDTPEIHQSNKFEKQLERSQTDSKHFKALGERAAAFTRSLLPPGTKIRLVDDVERRDRYGRRLSYVYLMDGTFLNREILSRGYAHLATFPPNVSRLEELRSAYIDARLAQRGLWSFAEFSRQQPEGKFVTKDYPESARRIRRLP